MVVPVTEERLRLMLARLAKWLRASRDGDLVPALPPMALVKTLLATPDAGLPVLGPRGAEYPLTPDELAEALAGFVRDYGLRLVCGCCGTTPAHIRAVADAIGSVTPALRHPRRLARARVQLSARASAPAPARRGGAPLDGSAAAAVSSHRNSFDCNGFIADGEIRRTRPSRRRTRRVTVGR